MVDGAGHALIATLVRVLLGSVLANVGSKQGVQIATHASARRESLQGSVGSKAIVQIATLVRVLLGSLLAIVG